MRMQSVSTKAKVQDTAVVIPVLTSHYMLLQRNLLYTAVTAPAARRAGWPAQSHCDGCPQQQSLRTLHRSM